MNIVTFLQLYAISVPIFFAIDMFWLGVVASSLYREALKDFLGPVNWPVAITFYLVFLVGLTWFVTYPAAVNGLSWHKVLITGALFGFFTYATYDLTNLATIKNWPVSISLIDMMWGTVLGALVSVVTYGIYLGFIK